MSRNILQGLVGAWCPSLGPSGYRLLDRTVRANHGTLTNMDAGSDWLGSPGGWALDFDGTNDYVSIPNRLSYTSGQWLSVSAWFRRNVTSAYHEIINKFNGTSAANEDGWLVRVTNGNKLLFTIGQSGSYGQFESTATYSDTAWHHIMVSLCVGAGSTLKMYYDGAEVAFLMSLDVIVSDDVVPSNTSGQLAPSHPIAQTSIDREAVGLVPVVSLPETMMSVKPSVVLSITDDSMPASRFVSLARLATAQVSVCLLP